MKCLQVLLDHKDEDKDNGTWNVDVEQTTTRKAIGKSVMIIAKIIRKCVDVYRNCTIFTIYSEFHFCI